MNKLALSRRLHIIILGIAACGLLFYAFLLPYFLSPLREESASAFWIYLVFLSLSGIPCYTALIYAWQIVSSIALDRSFSEENAARLRKISTLATVDAAYIFAGNPILLLLGLGEPIFLLLSLIIVFIGVAVAVAAAALSHLVLRAAELQEQSDLTI